MYTLFLDGQALSSSLPGKSKVKKGLSIRMTTMPDPGARHFNSASNNAIAVMMGTIEHDIDTSTL